ncbi:MAG: adenosine kinase [Pseudomonadales bacterium]|nr:adenosine kinase [Pseudomonadales bacterium]
MSTFDVYALGNALVDREYRVSDAFLVEHGIQKGMMTLINETQRHQLLQALDHEFGCIKQASGGSAANSIIAVAALGGRSFYACRIAADAHGDFYAADLQAAGVCSNLNQQRPEGHTGTCLVMVTEDAERTMHTHLGITADVSEEDVVVDALQAAQWLYIEGYLAPSDSARQAVIHARKLARESGVKIALTCSDPSMVTYFREALLSMIGDGVDLIFCNQEEALGLSGCSDLESALQQLSHHSQEIVITRGSEGALVYHQGQIVNIPAFVVAPVDTNGAGDMFAGCYLFGRCQGMPPLEAGLLASRASSEVVCQFGPRLPLQRYTELLEEHRKSLS